MWNISAISLKNAKFIQQLYFLILLPWLKYKFIFNNNFFFKSLNFIFIPYLLLNKKLIKLNHSSYKVNKFILNKPTNLINFFIKLTNQSITSFFKVHPTQRFNYIYNLKQQTYIINIIKFQKHWVNLYNLLYHIFFFNIPFIAFNSPFFKRENISFNWKLIKSYTLYWKLINNTIWSSKNLNLYGINFLIRYLLRHKVNIVMVLSTLMRKNILKVMHKFKFYSIGVIPINVNLYSVNFAIPVSTDSIFLELFLVRFILQIKKQVKWHFIDTNKTLWFKTLFI